MFCEYPQQFNETDTHIVFMRTDSKTTQDIMDDFRSKLPLPDYFADNWDSLYDCLFSLEGIKTKKVALIFDSLPDIDKNHLKKLIHVLNHATTSWNESDEYQFITVFPENSRQLISNFLCDY